MKLKLIILKFRLFKFLGRFIPYFKKMGISREDLRKRFNDTVNEWFKDFSNDDGTFKFREGIYSTIVSDKPLKIKYPIEYGITYKNMIDFSISFYLYEDKVERILSYIPSEVNDFTPHIEIGKFLEYFDKMMKKDNEKLLTDLNRYFE